MHERSLALLSLLAAGAAGAWASGCTAVRRLADVQPVGQVEDERSTATGGGAVIGNQSATDRPPEPSYNSSSSPPADSETASLAFHQEGPCSTCQNSHVRQASAPFDPPYAISSAGQAEDSFFCDTPALTRLPPVESDAAALDVIGRQWSLVLSDHAQYYSVRGLTGLTAGIGVGALMANTRFDENFLRDTYAENVVLAPTHEFYERLHQPKALGNGWYVIPVFALTAVCEPILGDGPFERTVADWGQRSLRSVLVGGPPMLALQC
jgi:hypothetical protein